MNNKTTIYFKYGSMNSGKSLELIKVAYNYQENNIKCLIIKPSIDTRVVGKVYSRTGLSMDAYEADVCDLVAMKNFLLEHNDCFVILVEEANFFSKEIIDEIINFGYDNNIKSVMFFGLKVDFRGNLFEGSKRIIERADKIEESTSICWCGKKARQNGRVVNNQLTKEGETIVIEDGKSVVEYVTLCNYHFYMGQLGNGDKK